MWNFLLVPSNGVQWKANEFKRRLSIYMRLEGRPCHISLSCLICTFCSASASYSLDVQSVLAGWQADADALKNVGSYEIKGSEHREVFVTGYRKTTSSAWNSTVSGNLYKLTTKNFEADVVMDSFDGELWYGFSQRGHQLAGSIFANPQKSAEITPLDHLLSKSDWSYYWRLQDPVERIAVANTVSVIEIFRSNDRYLTLSEQNSEPTLEMNEARAKELKVPHRITFIPISRGFLPKSLELVDHKGALSSVISIKIIAYNTIKGQPYPSKILQSIFYRGPAKSDEKNILEAVDTFEAIAIQTPKASAFVLDFPDETPVWDDRKSGVEKVKIHISPRNWFAENFRPILVVILGLLSLVLVLVKVKRSAH